MLEDTVVSLPDGGTRPAVLAVPDTEGAVPGVVIIHDIFGLQPDTRRHCRRFAEAGYAAIAPDLYDGGRVRCVVSTLLAMQRRQGRAYDVIAAARRRLAEHPRLDADRIGITGFCMGGGFALLAAADDAYAVAAPFYGDVPERKERLKNLCPTIAQYGARDASFRSHAERLSKHLEALEIEHEVLIHPGAGHSFMNDHDLLLARVGRHTPMRAAYEPTTEALAWEKLLAFFDAHMPAAS
ncbi:MAG TPA: dienelactone hydrolase family protein [Sandaracinaceae bacterium LLY-WYZ-13_1]|nr:dienelactone hydrolase family protein [Sandaracinaceae bacterium LLY-WYZ-13_1]